MMVLQLFHQADLCLLFNRFMSRTVFAYTECVVCPNEFHRNLHQSCHTYGRFHIVREYEECTASSNDTAVEHHTDAAAGHGQLGYACLEKRTAEITGSKGVCLLQEAVGLIRIGKVGRSANHVGHLFCQCAQYGSRGVTGGITCFLFDGSPVHLGCCSAEPFGLLCCFLGIGTSPCFFFFHAGGYDTFQFFGTFGFSGSAPRFNMVFL